MSDLRHEIRRTVAEIGGHVAQLDRLEGDVAVAACRVRLAGAFQRLESLQAKLPTIPTTFSDLAIMAEVAHAWAWKDERGVMVALDPGSATPDCHFAARLIQAVLMMAGPERHVQRGSDA